MPREDLQTYQHNLHLKQQFDLLGLHLSEVFEFTPMDLDLENRRLESLLNFVKKYQQYGNRETMELLEGPYCWPPIFPGIDPDSDWYRFELWLMGQPTRKTIAEQMPETFIIKNPEEIPEDEMEAELDKLLNAVNQAGYGISLNEGIPARVVYCNVMEWIGEKLELDGPFGGGWTFDGCSGWCPGCFQRPWCEFGNSSCWREDEEAGKMCLPDELNDYVSASPQSFSIISKLQAEEDAKMEKWKQENEKKQEGPFLDHEGLRGYEDDGSLPF